MCLRLCVGHDVAKMRVLRIDGIAGRGMGIGDVRVLLMLLLLSVRIGHRRPCSDGLLVRHHRTTPLHCLVLCRRCRRNSGSRCTVSVGSQHGTVAHNRLLTLGYLSMRLSGGDSLSRIHTRRLSWILVHILRMLRRKIRGGVRCAGALG